MCPCAQRAEGIDIHHDCPETEPTTDSFCTVPYYTLLLMVMSRGATIPNSCSQNVQFGRRSDNSWSLGHPIVTQ